MAAEIPLKIRVDIRDLWDGKDSSVQHAVNNLAKTLGYKVVPRVEWPALWGELGGRFPDKTTFVPTIARLTTSWYDLLQGRLENDTHSTWTEKLLDVLSLASRGNSLTLQIEPCPPNGKRPTTTWRTKSNTFYLGIPNTEPASSSGIYSALEKDFDNLLDAGDTARPEEDGWDDVMEEAAQPRHHTTSRTTPQTAAPEPGPPPTARLPELNEIARPTELFSSTTPSILIVEHRGNKIWIQCSHERSIDLLASYLKKWGRTNPNDSMKRAILTVELHDSDFCFGVIDALTVEPTMSHLTKNVVLNPTIALAFIEGVLGYKLVYTNGAYWMYRSTTLLK